MYTRGLLLMAPSHGTYTWKDTWDIIFHCVPNRCDPCGVCALGHDDRANTLKHRDECNKQLPTVSFLPEGDAIYTKVLQWVLLLGAGLTKEGLTIHFFNRLPMASAWGPYKKLGNWLQHHSDLIWICSLARGPELKHVAMSIVEVRISASSRINEDHVNNKTRFELLSWPISHNI